MVAASIRSIVLAAVTVLTFAGRPALAGQAGAAAPLADTDVGDLLRALRDKPPPPPPDPNAAPSKMFVIAPVIGSKPDLDKNGRHRLAAWVMGNFVVAGTPPYYDLPATGMDTFGHSGRGYEEGRFRGERLMYGEVEYRTTLMANGLLGMVAFLNATTVSSRDSGENLFESVAIGAGGGLRLLLNKRSRTNLCADIGFGKDGSHGFYLAVQEAF